MVAAFQLLTKLDSMMIFKGELLGSLSMEDILCVYCLPHDERQSIHLFYVFPLSFSFITHYKPKKNNLLGAF